MRHFLMAICLVGCTAPKPDNGQQQAYDASVKFITGFLRDPDGAVFEPFRDYSMPPTDTIAVFGSVTSLTGLGGREKERYTLYLVNKRRVVGGIVGDTYLTVDQWMRGRAAREYDSLDADPRTAKSRYALDLQLDALERSIIPSEAPLSSIFKQPPYLQSDAEIQRHDSMYKALTNK